MKDDWIFLLPDARRHFAAADRSEQRGDIATAGRQRALGAAYQLYSEERDYKPRRGEYLRPMAEFADRTVPDMATFRDAAILDLYRVRLPRTHSLARRARLADILWEFAGDATAAREAIDAYEQIAHHIIGRGGQFDAFHGSAALVRAFGLARNLHDEPRAARLLGFTLESADALAKTKNSAALFALVELLLERGDRSGPDLDRLAAALGRHLDALRASDAENFHFEQTTVELLERLARARKDDAEAVARSRERGEAIVREAEWKLTHVDNGGLVAGFFFERAARHFERLGDLDRAHTIRAREREALRGAEFHRIEGEVEVDLTPYQRVIKTLLDAQGPQAFWVGWLYLVELPSEAAFDAFERDSETPLLDLFGTSTVDDDLIVDMPDAAESKRRRAKAHLYVGIRAHILTFFGVARDRFGVKAAMALDVLASSDRLDKTAFALLERVLVAVDGKDWVTAAYLSGPLFERLVRAIATAQGLPVQQKDRNTDALVYVPIENVLRKIAIDEPLRTFALYVLGRPGLNARNLVGHGLLEADKCTVDLTAVLLFLVCALAFAAPPAENAST